MEDSRVNKVINSFTSCKKEVYRREEELPELRKLRDEIVKLTFKDNYVDDGSLKLWDAENYLEKQNEECYGIATEELQRFKNSCKDLNNMIKGVSTGYEGEQKTFNRLERIQCAKRILKNIEFTKDDVRTELDAVVITKGCVYIIETKNTSKNIFIDEEGNYNLTGDFLKFDKNIKDKLADRENFVKQILKEAGYEKMPVQSILVFTNNRITVKNRCADVKTAFVSQLPYLIEENIPLIGITDQDINVISQAIEKERKTEAYPIKFEVDQLKENFAQLVIKLEDAMKPEEAVREEVQEVISHHRKNSFSTIIRNLIHSPAFRLVPAAAMATFSLVTVISRDTFR